MIFLVLIPIIFTYLAWRRCNLTSDSCRVGVARLLSLRQLFRCSVAIHLEDANAVAGCPISYMTNDAAEDGLSCAAALQQGAFWLRVAEQKNQKCYRTIGLWFARLLAVVSVAVFVRIYMNQDLRLTMNGASATDSGFIILGSLFLLASTVVFLRMIPQLELDTSGYVSGFVPWLRDRILTDNGRQTMSIDSITLRNLELEEWQSGLSLYSEKVEALDVIWRDRISALETKCEASIEMMPLLEFVGFGVFLVCFLISPLLKISA